MLLRRHQKDKVNPSLSKEGGCPDRIAPWLRNLEAKVQDGDGDEQS